MIYPQDPRTSRLGFGGLLVLMSWALLRKKLTPLGVVTAVATGLLHLSFPSTQLFAYLAVFFLAGTGVTRVGKKVKAGITTSSTGGAAEGPRNETQVLANSGTASIFILLAFLQAYTGLDLLPALSGPLVPRYPADEGLARRVVFGAACSYAAAAADTFSSELGILSKSSPFMIVPPFRKVPRGTNGGVTLLGLLVGLAGATLIAAIYGIQYQDMTRTTAIALLGLGGSVLDSLLGALVQATVEDKRTGKVVEGVDGSRVLVGAEGSGSRVLRGRDWLTNNGVNFTMTFAIGELGLVLDGLLS